MQWRAILKESGFVDIENNKNPDLPVKSDVRRDSKKFSDFASVQEYFLKASHYLNKGSFESEREKEVWKLHSEGQSMQEIGKLLGLSKTTVHYYVHKIMERIK
jgi:DNA-binding NarL/FixJ family response regulator